MKKQGEGARVGLVLVAGHFPPALQTKLKVLAAERSTVQGLLAEAIELLFARRRRKAHEKSA